ncbi:MAG: hypothetical protein AAGA28_04755 [Pseudomonadota bacterium]
MSFFSSGLKTLSCVACICAAVTAHADTELDGHVGPIASFVELGESGAWTSAIQDGWYTLTNDGALGEIQYFWASQPSVEGQDFSVSANVFTQPSNGDTSHAGLIFHYRDADRYLAVTIASDGGAYAFIRTPDGLDVTPASDVSARLDGSDVLALAVRGNQVTTTLNGETMFTIDVDGEGPTRNLGVFAAGSGVAAFTDMTLR